MKAAAVTVMILPAILAVVSGNLRLITGLQ